MTKKDFVRKVAAITGVTQNNINEIMSAFREVAIEALAEEDEVKVFDGVTLYGAKANAYTARNPMTGEPVEVPARIKVKARFAPSFKAEVNK